MSEARARRLAQVIRRALLMIVAAIEAEFGLRENAGEREAG